MASKVTMIVSLSVFVLLIAFALPQVITAVEGGTAVTLIVTDEVDETVQVTAGLTVSGSDFGQNEVTATLRDTQTGQTTNATITEGDTANLTLRGENINVTNQDSTTSEAELLVAYPRTYGWGTGGKAFLEQFELIVAVVAILSVTAVLKAMVDA